MDLFLGIILILGAHYVADFILQPREIADKKSYDALSLGIHVVIYAVSFFVLFCLYGLILHEFFVLTVTMQHWFQMGVGITVINGLFHFVIDFFSSKVSKYFWRTEQIRNFWLVIGFDQLLHTGILVYCYAEMLKNFGYI